MYRSLALSPTRPPPSLVRALLTLRSSLLELTFTTWTALFPAAKPPKKTPYSLYTSSGSIPTRGHPESTILAAETDEMEYESRNQMGVGIGGGEGESSGEAAGYSVQ
jgi:hypothetical protein